MKTYWFYLEPYTFLFQKNEDALIYNTLSGKSIPVKISPDIKHIIETWDKPENFYTVEISEVQYKNKKIASLIKKVRNSFSGDIIEEKTESERPVILKPFLNFQKDRIRLEDNRSFSTGDNVLKELSSLTLYLTGKCNQNCQYCSTYFKQFACCTKNDDKSASITEIENTLNHLVGSNLSQLHILGGNLASIPNINDFVSLFDTIPVKKNYYANYLNITPEIVELLSKYTLRILCNFPVDTGHFEKIYHLIQSNEVKSQWIFIITSEEEYFEAKQFINSLNLEDAIIKPFFTGENSAFFENNIYSYQEDINDIKLNRRQIFANQTINVNEFGKLTIFSDGQVYGNINFPPLGNMDDDFRKMIYTELTNGQSWFRIRNHAPCDNCTYQWICPSPSNYEIAIGKHNLCHIKQF